MSISIHCQQFSAHLCLGICANNARGRLPLHSICIVIVCQRYLAGFCRHFGTGTQFASNVLLVLEMNHRSYVRFAVFSSALIILAGSTGCGSKVPFDFAPVHGKVTYEDGSLINADSILVTFNPVLTGDKGKIVPPGGQTQVNVKDGTFSAVSSHRKDDGVAVGRHKVVVVAFKKAPNGASVPSPAVPPAYHKVTSTPLEVEVESENQFLELKVRKK
jgi:hypothetical protein